MSDKRLTKNERREAARAKALELRVAEEKKKKRRRIAIWATSLAAVLGIGGLITAVVVTNSSLQMAASVTAPNNMGTDGVILTSETTVLENEGYNLEEEEPLQSATLLEEAGSEVPHVEVYLDYACPHCAEFEEANAEYIHTLLAGEQATVEFKPIVVIGSQLSFSAGNAAACVAQYAPEKFLQFHTSLFSLTNSGTVGNNRTIRPLVSELGLDGEVKQQVTACMNSDVFNNWLLKATETSTELETPSGGKLVTGTPTILVDGVKFPYTYDAFPAFMEEVKNGKTPEEVIAMFDEETSGEQSPTDG